MADASNSADWVAIDLLSQAEHDEAAQAILITDDADFADQVSAAVDAILPTLPRVDVAGRHGVIMVRSLPLKTGKKGRIWPIRLLPNISKLQLMTPMACRRKSVMQAPFSLGATHLKPLVIMLQAQTMSCQRRGHLAFLWPWGA